MTRLTVAVDGRRVGSILLDGQTARLVVAPTSSEQDLWEALERVYAALQGIWWVEVEVD
jgi:Mg-chelatase subunit ChlD